MGWLDFAGPVIGAVGNIASAWLGSSSAKRANETNVGLSREQMQWSTGQAAVARGFEADQARISRDFNAAEAQRGRDFSSSEAGRQRDWSSAEAQKAREFEANMSNTAVQRHVADLAAAGLNPMLGYAGSASTPNAPMPSGASASAAIASSTPARSGGLPSYQRAEVKPRLSEAVINNIASAVSSGLQARNLAAQTRVINAQAAKTEMETKVAAEQVGLTASSAQESQVRTELYRQQIPKMREEVEKVWHEVQLLKKENVLKQGDVLKLKELIDQQVATARASLELTEKRDLREKQYVQSWMGQNIAPYLDDAEKIARIAGNLSLLNGIRQLRALIRP